MKEEELSYIIVKEIITEEYETLIFDYLVNNCINLKDEDIKKIVDLKCKQFIDVLKENKKQKKEQKELVSNNKRLSKVAERRYENILELQQENQQLKSQLEQRDNIINKVREYNEQIIKDTKDFYRPTSDRIYSGDCLIDIATQIIKTLDNKGDES